MKSLLSVLVVLLCWSQPSLADDKIAAEGFLKSKLDAVMEVIQDKTMELEKKNSRIDEIFSPALDFPLMAKLSLGKKHWPSMTPENQERFTQLIIIRLKRTYFDKLPLYAEEKIVYSPPVQVGQKVQIPTVLLSADDKTSIVYKLYKSKKNWKIYDIEIQGVSIIRSYRSEFNHILETGTIDDLLLKMEASVADNG